MLTSSKGNLEISLKSPTFPTCMYIIHQTEETGWEKERKENITELKMPKKKTKTSQCPRWFIVKSLKIADWRR